VSDAVTELLRGGLLSDLELIRADFPILGRTFDDGQGGSMRCRIRW
jgi:hypothetical protein